MPCSVVCRAEEHATVLDCPCSSGRPEKIAALTLYGVETIDGWAEQGIT
ncbi:hypothetical protein [Streptomyces sp. NPDC018693]